MPSSPREALWAELDQILDRGYTGSITLHAGKGRVVQYVINEVKHPGNGSENRREIEAKTPAT